MNNDYPFFNNIPKNDGNVFKAVNGTWHHKDGKRQYFYINDLIISRLQILQDLVDKYLVNPQIQHCPEANGSSPDKRQTSQCYRVYFTEIKCNDSEFISFIQYIADFLSE